MDYTNSLDSITDPRPMERIAGETGVTIGGTGRLILASTGINASGTNFTDRLTVNSGATVQIADQNALAYAPLDTSGGGAGAGSQPYPEALAAGAKVVAWDDNAARRDAALGSGIPVAGLADTDLGSFKALVLSPGIPSSFPKPHPVAARAKDARIPENLQAFAVDSVSKSRVAFDKLSTVAKDQAILELENEKAVASIPSTAAGVVEKVFVKVGDRIAVGLDVKGHTLAARGWTQEGGDLWETLGRLDAAGCARYVVTDVDRDGTLHGPNLDLLRAVCGATDRPIVASGGVGSLSHVHALTELVPLGVEGAIIGKALYAGEFTLAEALVAVEATLIARLEFRNTGQRPV